jgi:hypothetical protein
LYAVQQHQFYAFLFPVDQLHALKYLGGGEKNPEKKNVRNDTVRPRKRQLLQAKNDAAGRYKKRNFQHRCKFAEVQL